MSSCSRVSPANRRSICRFWCFRPTWRWSSEPITMTKPVFLFLLLNIAAAFGAAPAFAGPFDSWAALVVAGDSRAHSGAPSEVFDNARRDLVTALKQMGFAENHIQQF